jgi:uncharacterized phage infection (PIP) family protein YhgE
MKKYLILFIVLLMALSVNVGTVRAQGERNETRAQMKERVEAMRMEAKQKMNALRVQIKGEKDAAQAKIKELRITGREQALTRFDTAVERINNLRNKVDAYILTLEAKGLDTAEAKSFLTTANAKLNDATAKIAEMNALLSASINQLSKEDKTNLVTLAQDTQKLVREAHLALVDAVKSLKDIVKKKVTEPEPAPVE